MGLGPSELIVVAMGRGPIELIVVALVIVLLIRAVNRGGGIATVIGLVLLLAIGGWALFRARSGEMDFRSHQVQHTAAPAWDMQHGGHPPEIHIAPAMWRHRDARLSLVAVVLVLLIGVLAVGRRHGLGIGGVLALGIVGVVLFMFVGSVATYRQVELAPAQVAMTVDGSVVEVHHGATEPPIDELWERLNESRIQLSSAAEEATHQAIAAAAAVTQAASAAEAEAVKQAAAEAVTIDPHKAATAGRVPEDSDAATEEPPTEEPAVDEATNVSWDENTEAAIEGQVDEVADDSAAGEPAADWSDDAVEPTPPAEQAPPPVDTAAPPVEPAQPAFEEFAEPQAEDWPQEPASSAAPAESLAALPDPEPKPRPEWVGAPPKVVENIYRVPVQAGPYVTLRECYDELRNEMRTVVQQRVEELVRESTGTPYAHIPDLDWMHIGASYIDRELLTDEYVEINDTSVGTMRTAWGLLEFTPNHDRYLVDSWKRYARQDRMAMVATMAALVLGALGSVLMLLKIDTWTRGYYTKRLFLGVPAAIIAFIALIAMIAEM
jgi:hypothetical protein